MYAVKLSPETADSCPRASTHVTPDHDTATVYRQAPKPGDVIDAWARHVGASNGFGDAAIGDTPCPYVMPYWKSR